jgi:DNA-binding response OmpR family regulator
MLASAVNSALQSVPFPNSKPRLLLVSDDYDRLKSLEAGFNHNEFEITTVCSLEELVTACNNCHDMVALDVSPEQIAPMLKQIRTSASHMTAPVLVEATRLSNDLSIAGLLPEYRAMPCSRMEMLALVQRGVAPPEAGDPARRHIL